MNVTVRTYGGVRDGVGRKTVDVDLPPDATVADAVDAVEAATGGDAHDGRGRLLAMRDGTHLDADDALNDGDVLSLSDEPVPDV